MSKWKQLKAATSAPVEKELIIVSLELCQSKAIWSFHLQQSNQ